jgi:beta-mannosidase
MAQKIPRFASEFGMQSMPEMATIKAFSVPEDWDTSSVVMKVHQKHSRGFRNLGAYLKMEKLEPKTFEEYVTATQEVQSRALETAIRAQINSHGRCMGTLFWQFNDCWPVTSWSIVDYYGRKKKAYHTVKKCYAEHP